MPSGGESRPWISCPGRRPAWTEFPTRCCWTERQRRAECWSLMIGERLIGHFRDHLAAGKFSPGLLVVSQGSAIGDVVEAVLYVWALSDPAELRDQAYYLPSISRHFFTR